MRVTFTLLAVLLGVVPLSAAPSRAGADPVKPSGLVVIAHPSVAVDSIGRDELSKIFLKRLRTWADGESARPVDQSPESPVREEFSRLVHERSAVTIEVYWKRMIFSGRTVPPKVLPSDKEILEYVRTTLGAVGYVRSGLEIDGVKRLELTE